MQLGTVIGHATSTIKHRSLNGCRLAVGAAVERGSEPEADPVLAVDRHSAGPGQRVILNTDGKAAREVIGDDKDAGSVFRDRDRGRMIVTARQLEDLHAPERVQWPRDAPLPGATDAAGERLGSSRRRSSLGTATCRRQQARAAATDREAASGGRRRTSHAGASVLRLVVRWSLRPGEGRGHRRMKKNRRFAPLDKPADAKQTGPGHQEHRGRGESRAGLQGAMLLVQNGALATIMPIAARRFARFWARAWKPSNKACSRPAANVLIIEYPYKTLQQIRNMLLALHPRQSERCREDVQRQLGGVGIMRIGQVVGRLCLNTTYETLVGGRFLIVAVQDRFALAGEKRKTQ